MVGTNILTPLQESDIPNAREAKSLIERVHSGRLTEEHPFGEIVRLYIYGDIVNEKPQSFKDTIKDFVDIASRFSERL